MPEDLEPGSILVDKYRIERVLGRGGMGVVVEATHLALDELVAIKILRPDAVADKETLTRFLREARTASKLKCEFAPRISDVGNLPSGAPYMVMELLEGEDLKQLLVQNGRIAPDVVIDLMMQVCVALAEAHALGIVHRDIKPGNLFVVWKTNALCAKLVDFGISKVAVEDVGLTTTRALLGTPAYMAPEQWKSAREADHRSDIWSLGVVMYELLEGQRPFLADNYAELCFQVTTEAPPPMTLQKPAGLDRVIEKCLARDPGDRYPDVVALARDLARFAPDGRRASIFIERMQRYATRSRPNRATAEPPARGDDETAVGTAPRRSVRTLEAPARHRRRLPVIMLVGAIAGALAVTGWWLLRGDEPGVRRGGVLRSVGKDAPGATMSLFSSTASTSQMAMRFVVEDLVELGPDDVIEPTSLVSVWPASDPRLLVLVLRSDAVFGDHPCVPGGRTATGADLAFSLEQARAAQRLGLAIEQTTVSGNVVVLRLAGSAPFYKRELANVLLVPREVAGCLDLAAMTRPVGTGPFQIVDTPAGSLVLAASRAYRDRGAGEPHLDRIVLESPQDPQSVLGRMRSGASSPVHLFAVQTADWETVFDLTGTAPRLRDDPGNVDVVFNTIARLHEVGSLRLQLTRKAGALDNRLVRRAIAHAIDRADIVSHSGTGPKRLAAPASRFLPADALGFTLDLERAALTYDVAKARAALEQAGFPGGAGLPELLFATYKRDRAHADRVVAQLGAVGIRARVTEIEPGRQARVLADGGGFDAIFVLMRGSFLGNEVVDLVVDLAFTRLSDELEQLKTQISAATDHGGRASTYAAIEARLLDELPAIPIAWLGEDYLTDIWVVGKQVRGFHDPRSRRFDTSKVRVLYRTAWLAD